MDSQLKALRRAETLSSADHEPSGHGSRWRRRARSFVPWAALVIVAILFGLLFGEHFLPARPVEVALVLTASAAETAAESAPAGPVERSGGFDGAVHFQASGWFEADPYPYRATALASGVVAEVHVLEGETVAAGAPLVTLVKEDAELRVQRARGALTASRATADAAERELAVAEAEVEGIAREIEVALARRDELADLAHRARELGPDVISAQDIEQRRLRLQTQERNIVALHATREARVLQAERAAAAVRAQAGVIEQTEARLREAELELARMTVRSPIDGVVQRLYVTPGKKRMLAADDPDSATVALLFDPQRLQARIDVPLADAAGLVPGQAVLVETEFFPGRTLRGRVDRVVGEADLQRNTLQAKVRIEDPPIGWRPEMLCRAKFLRGGDPSSRLGAMQASPGLRIFAPVDAIVESADGTIVWAVDASGKRVERRSVRLGETGSEGFRRVFDGLRPGDRVILQPEPDLRVGERIQY